MTLIIIIICINFISHWHWILCACAINAVDLCDIISQIGFSSMDDTVEEKKIINRKKKHKCWCVRNAVAAIDIPRLLLLCSTQHRWVAICSFASIEHLS